jgi:hypothetical protein
VLGVVLFAGVLNVVAGILRGIFSFGRTPNSSSQRSQTRQRNTRTVPKSKEKIFFEIQKLEAEEVEFEEIK